MAARVNEHLCNLRAVFAEVSVFLSLSIFVEMSDSVSVEEAVVVWTRTLFLSLTQRPVS